MTVNASPSLTVVGDAPRDEPEAQREGEGEEQSLFVSPKLVVLAAPKSPSAESIRQLRTRILAQHINKGRRALALCSPGLSNGCSFIAANLAISLAQTGVRVLLLNADLRSPGIDDLFGEIGTRPGLLQYLSSSHPHSNIGQHEILPSLSIMPSGGQAIGAQELLSSTRFETLVNAVAREYDFTLIDTAPANLYADAQRVATVAGYCAVVARVHKTYFNDVSELTQQLLTDGVHVVGTILNQH